MTVRKQLATQGRLRRFTLTPLQLWLLGMPIAEVAKLFLAQGGLSDLLLIDLQ